LGYGGLFSDDQHLVLSRFQQIPGMDDRRSVSTYLYRHFNRSHSPPSLLDSRISADASRPPSRFGRLTLPTSATFIITTGNPAADDFTHIITYQHIGRQSSS
jgi:hypothetical protein